MSAAEFLEWAIFFRDVPECARPEVGVAQICAMLAAALGAKRRNGESFRESDFLPDERLWRKANPEAAEEEEMKRVWRQFEVMERRAR